jgi:hypothetical protein
MCKKELFLLCKYASHIREIVFCNENKAQKVPYMYVCIRI